MIHFNIEFGMRLLYCKGGSGGSSGGGGGGSGVVDYPAHMKAWHTMALDHTGVDTLTDSITDVMNVALGADPFVGETTHDPDNELATMLASINDLDVLVALLSSGTGLDDLIINILSDSRIDDAVDEFSLDLGDRLIAEVLPRFEAGMRDINAVVSSAFAIGRGIIEDGQTRQVAKYSADLHLKAFGDDALRLIALKLEYQKFLSHMTVEANRIKIVAKKEEADANLDIMESAATWDLNVFQHGANLLASIGGGVVVPDEKKKSQMSSAIGGALSGAAAGAMIGSAVPGIGTGIGAAAGAVLGAASSFL